MSLGHLSRRFMGALSTRPPAPGDDAWAASHLLAGEEALWRRMSNPDRRHAIEVTRRFLAARPRSTRPEVAAALLHDCGKVESGLGTFARVGATVWIAVAGRERVATGDGRLGRYARHEPLGAELLADAGSDPLTVALVAGSPGAPAPVLAALHRADDL